MVARGRELDHRNRPAQLFQHVVADVRSHKPVLATQQRGLGRRLRAVDRRRYQQCGGGILKIVGSNPAKFPQLI